MQKKEPKTKAILKYILSIALLISTAFVFFFELVKILSNTVTLFNERNILRLIVMLLCYVLFENSYNFLMGYKIEKPLRFTLFHDFLNIFMRKKSSKTEEEVGKKYYKNGKTKHPTQDSKEVKNKKTPTK